MEGIRRIQTGGISFYVQGEIRPAMRGGFMDASVYHGVLDKTILVNVDVVLVNRERRAVYLVRRTARPMLNEWWWFGGRRKKGESPVEGVRRSFRQELGFALPAERFEFVDVIEYIWQEREQEPRENGSHHIAHQFALEPGADELAAVRRNIAERSGLDPDVGLQEFGRERILAEGLHPAVLEVYDKIFVS